MAIHKSKVVVVGKEGQSGYMVVIDATSGPEFCEDVEKAELELGYNKLGGKEWTATYHNGHHVAYYVDPKPFEEEKARAAVEKAVWSNGDGSKAAALPRVEHMVAYA